jgi:CDP-glycerol glycerophosphotransferase (TagB/SpsB family)
VIIQIYNEEGLAALLSRILFEIFDKPIEIIISISDNIISNDSRVVLFGSRDYADNYNSEYLYYYVYNNKPNLKPVYVANNWNTYINKSNKGEPVVFKKSLKMIYYLSVAETAFITHGKYDICYKPSAIPNNISIVMLGHGDPVKFGPDFSPNNEMKSDYKITTSEFLVDIYSDDFGQNRDALIVTGYPRNDPLMDPPVRYQQEWNNFTCGNSFDTVILYAPTKRLTKRWESPVELFPFDDYSLPELSEYLTKYNALLCIRLHPSDMKRLNQVNVPIRYKKLDDKLQQMVECDNIDLAGVDEFNHANKLLPFVDVLVTDYSSIYHDFLLLDRPILFIPYDYNQFEQKIGFKYDYYSNLPGPIVNSFQDFLNHIDTIQNKGDLHQTDRRELLDKIHTYKDDKSSERVTGLINRF